MKPKKRRLLLVALAVVLLISFGICLLAFTKFETPDKSRNQKQNDSVKTTEKVTEEPAEELAKKIENNRLERQLESVEIQLLEPHLTADQLSTFKAEVKEFLTQDMAFDVVRKLTLKAPVIETENNIKFYGLLDDPSTTVLYADYDKTKEKFRFWTALVPAQEAEKEWQEKESQIVETQDWSEEEKLPTQWDYEEPDQGPVILSEKQVLETKIPEGAYKQLETELQKFLVENQEYRRELKLKKESIKETDLATEFVITFQTPRLDKKEVHVVYDKNKNTYQFALQEA